MRIFIAFLALATAACQTQTNRGTGPLTLSINNQVAFQKYLDSPMPSVFFIAEDGRYTYSTHCAHGRCEPDFLYMQAQRACEEKAGKPCKILAEGQNIVWDGPIAYASTGAASNFAATVEWGGQGTTGTFYIFKIDGAPGGVGTLSGKIQGNSCDGTINFQTASWKIKCDKDMRAQGSLSKSGDNKWGGLGYSSNNNIVRLFITENASLNRGGPSPTQVAAMPQPAPPPAPKPAKPAVGGFGAAPKDIPRAANPLVIILKTNPEWAGSVGERDKLAVTFHFTGDPPRLENVSYRWGQEQKRNAVEFKIGDSGIEFMIPPEKRDRWYKLALTKEGTLWGSLTGLREDGTGTFYQVVLLRPVGAPVTTNEPTPAQPDMQTKGDTAEKLRALKKLLDDGVITKGEHDAKRKKILDDI